MVLLGENYTESRAEEIRERLGLQRPLVVQFVGWVGRAVQGDLGSSIFLRQEVSRLLLQRGLVTLTLAVLTMLVSIAIAIPLGVISAVKRDSWVDNLTRVVSMAGISMPVFWFGLLLMLVFALHLRWLPPGGSPSQYGMRAYILPALTLGIHNAALLTRMTRATMLETLNQDYIRTARSKGLRRWTIQYKHAFRNALVPIVTIAGLQLGSLLGGAVLTEFIFSLPGLGSLLIDSVYRRDFPVIQGSVLLTGLVFVLTTTMIDILYAAIDPRIRY